MRGEWMSTSYEQGLLLTRFAVVHGNEVLDTRIDFNRLSRGGKLRTSGHNVWSEVYMKRRCVRMGVDIIANMPASHLPHKFVGRWMAGISTICLELGAGSS